MKPLTARLRDALPLEPPLLRAVAGRAHQNRAFPLPATLAPPLLLPLTVEP